MRFLKHFANRLWAAWALLTFVLSFLVIFIPSMLTWLVPNPRGQWWFISLARIWMRVWLFLVGCPFRVSGRKNFQAGKTYVVVYNHNSLLDVPLSCPFVPGPNKTIAKTSFARVPLFGWYYRKGSVLVDRKSESSRRKSFEEMKAVLAGGMHMCIYPEGTRNRTGEPLKKFYDGAFKLAVETGRPIIPAVIFNTARALPADSGFYFRPMRLRLDYLPPVSSEGLSAEALKDKVYERMKTHYLANK